MFLFSYFVQVGCKGKRNNRDIRQRIVIVAVLPLGHGFVPES